MPPEVAYVSVSRRVFRMIPDGPDNDPRNPTFAALSSRNRWNSIGEPTLYLAADLRVAAVEWARHVAVDPRIAVELHEVPRRLYAMTLAVDWVDLRDPATCHALGIVGAPMSFLEGMASCRSLSTRLRRETPARALIIPSMALLDQPERFVVVLFVDKLPTYPEPFITAIETRGLLPAEL